MDDDADDRKLFIEAVKDIDLNIKSISANNGEQALALLTDPENSLAGCPVLMVAKNVYLKLKKMKD